MQFFVNKIVDAPVAGKIDNEAIKKQISLSELPNNFEDFEEVVVTLVARKMNDYAFDVFSEEGKIYFAIPIIYKEVLNGTEEEVTQLCVKLFNEYKFRFSLDQTLPKIKGIPFAVKKIVDPIVADKINLPELRAIFEAVEFPEDFSFYNELIVTFVVRAANDYEFNAYDEGRTVYFTIPLNYEYVLKSSEEEVMDLCTRLFDGYKDEFVLGTA